MNEEYDEIPISLIKNILLDKTCDTCSARGDTCGGAHFKTCAGWHLDRIYESIYKVYTNKYRFTSIECP